MVDLKIVIAWITQRRYSMESKHSLIEVLGSVLMSNDRKQKPYLVVSGMSNFNHAYDCTILTYALFFGSRLSSYLLGINGIYLDG